MAEIGTEMACHHVEQPVDPIHRNAQRRPDEAPPVSGNHVAGAHLIGLTGTALQARRGNAIGILLERLNLMMIMIFASGSVGENSSNSGPSRGRKSVVEGKNVYIRVVLGGRRTTTKK